MRVKIRYAVIPAGTYAGMPALWISPGKESEMSFRELQQTMMEQYEAMNIYFKLLAFDVRDRGFAEDEIGEVTQLLDWAMENVVPVHYLNGQERPSYVRMGGIIKTFIEDDQWLHYDTNELFWVPQSANAEEPELEGYEKVPKYVVLSNKFNVRAGMDLLMQCEKPWGLVNPPKKEVEILLYG